MYVDCNSGCVYTDYDSYKKDEKKIKYLVKQKLIESGKFDIYRGKQYAQYSKYCAEQYGTEMNHKYEMYLGIEDNLTSYEEKCCKQIYDSRRKKISRLKEKLTYRINHFDCLWLTLTFRNDVLSSSSESTRRKYIQEFCNSLNVPFYVANIDYGDKEKNSDSNEREHYHAIIQKDYLDMSEYRYGFVYVEKIKNTKNSITRISQYINKLTAHAYKDSTKCSSRLIYSRKKKSLPELSFALLTKEEQEFVKNF